MSPQVLQSNTAGPSAPKGDMPATLLWWLSSLPVTLESLYCALTASPPDSLATALQAYLAQHPEQATELHGILVEALERDFARWDRMRALIASPATSSASAEPRGEGGA